MKDAKILLLSETENTNYSVKRFQEEASKLDVFLKHHRYSEFYLDMRKSPTQILINESDILEKYSHFLLRSTLSQEVDHTHYALLLKNLIFMRGKKALNLNEKFRYFKGGATKIQNYIILNEVSAPIIKSINCASLEILKTKKEEIQFPIILKKARGSHGKQVYIMKSWEELIGFFEDNKSEHIGMYLIQDYIEQDDETKTDFRIITVGNEVIGAYKKVAPQGSITTNLGSGGHAEPVDMTDELFEIGKSVIAATGMDFTGIDVIVDKNNKPYILEVNSAPQFQGFEKATGINLAKKILLYLLDK